MPSRCLCVLLVPLALLVALAAASVIIPASFVIAFHVYVRAGDEPFVHRFLSQIYHPSNVYLVEFAHNLDLLDHIKRDLPDGGKNVHVRAADATVDGGVSEVLGTLSAMSFFIDLAEYTGKKFNYYVNTSPRDYPVLSQENVRTLLAWVYAAHSPPLNFFRFAPQSEWTKFASRYEQLHYDPSIAFSGTDFELKNLITVNVWNPDRKSRRREIAMADSSMIVTGDFVRLCTDSMLSKKVLTLFTDSELASEHFFGTLAHSSAFSVGNFVNRTSLRCNDLNLLLGERIQNLKSAADRHQAYSDHLRTLAENGSVTTTSHGCLFVGLVPNQNLATHSAQDMIDSAVISNQGSLNSSDESVFLKTVRGLVEDEVLKAVVAMDLDESARHEREVLTPII
jgi:Core-2/I-Branching enzyme